MVVIVKNVCADIYGKQKKQPDYPAGDYLEYFADEAERAISDTQDVFFQAYDLELVQNALLTLSEEYQSVLYLSVVSGKSREEIAALTDTSVETIKKRLYRARKMLREALEVQDGR